MAGIAGHARIMPIAGGAGLELWPFECRPCSAGIGVLTTSPGATYALASGTSCASPLVAGIAALLYAAPGSGLGPGPYFLQVESSGKSAFHTVIKNQDL